MMYPDLNTVEIAAGARDDRVNDSAIAAAFVDVLNSWLSPVQLDVIRALNASGHHANAEQSFCDANQAFLDAIARVLPDFDFDAGDESQCQMCNRVWHIAADLMQFRPVAERHFQNSFPDFPADDIPQDLPAHWLDVSWHNDACPSFELSTHDDDNAILLWIDYAAPALRDYSGGKRYALTLNCPSGDTITLHESDDWQEIRPLAVALAASHNL